MQYNIFRTGGIIYGISDIEFIQGKKGEFMKRTLHVEVPTQKSMATRTEILEFEFVFDECTMLDDYSESNWVDIVFTIRSRKWTDPKTNKEKIFNSLRVIDMRKGPNPFDEGKDLRNKPEDLSNTLVSELADNVKDWSNEQPKQDTLFDEDGYLRDDDNTDLPF